MVLAAEHREIVRVGALVADVAEGLAAWGGAGTRGVLALVPVPPVAGVDEGELLRDLLAEALLLEFLEGLLEGSVPLVGSLFRFLSSQCRLQPGTEESLPGVLEVSTGEDGSQSRHLLAFSSKM